MQEEAWDERGWMLLLGGEEGNENNHEENVGGEAKAGWNRQGVKDRMEEREWGKQE